MITVSKQIIQNQIIKYLDHIEQTGEEILITDQNNHPIIKFIPCKSKNRVEDVFKDYRGRVKYYDNFLKPETEEWEEI